MITSRRAFLIGLGAALITAPAIVRAGALMPVKQIVKPVSLYEELTLSTRRAFVPRLYIQMAADGYGRFHELWTREQWDSRFVEWQR